MLEQIDTPTATVMIDQGDIWGKVFVTVDQETFKLDRVKGCDARHEGFEIYLRRWDGFDWVDGPSVIIDTAHALPLLARLKMIPRCVDGKLIRLLAQ